MLQYTMRLRAQTWLRDRSIRQATAVAGSRPTGTGLRNMTRHPWGDSSGTEQGTRETGDAIRMGVIAAATIFHQETKDVSSDLMVDGEDTRRYLRTCGFTEAESEEIIAEARADQPSTSTTQDPVITLFRQHAFQDFLRKWPKQWARGRGDTAEEAARAGKTDAREASAGVVTPARTPARNDEGYVGTPSIPTPKALFTEHPRKLEEAHIMSIGEDPTHREVDALTPHSKPRARPGRWDKGPPLAATDAQGKSGDIRQPPAVGEGQQPDALAALLASSSALELAEEERLKRVRSGFRERRALRTCYAFKSRSPKEISELFYFAMDHPDLDVAVPQDLARCAADLAEMRRTKGSEWQKCCAKLYGYIGENARDILADFDEHYKRSPEDDASWGHTHTTQPHATHTYMQDARKAVEEPVHPPTPAPHHTHTTPNPPLLTPPLNQPPILYADWDYGENAENAQEKAGDRGVRMGGDVDDNGGTELIASQDDRGGGTEHEALATEASGPEGRNDRASADSEEEPPAPLASDEEEDNDRSEQRLGSSYTHTHTH